MHCFPLLPLLQETLVLNPVVPAANFEYWPIIVAAAGAMIFIVIAIIALWAVSCVLNVHTVQHILSVTCSIATYLL